MVILKWFHCINSSQPSNQYNVYICPLSGWWRRRVVHILLRCYFFVREDVNSPHKGPAILQVFLCHDIIFFSWDIITMTTKYQLIFMVTDGWVLTCKRQETWVNTFRLRQNGRHFPDDIFQCIFLFENVWIWIKISLKFVPKIRINNIPALVQIMAWRRRGGKPLSEPMMVNLVTHICITQPQWVNAWSNKISHGISSTSLNWKK